MAEEYRPEDLAFINSRPNLVALDEAFAKEAREDGGMIPKVDKYLMVGGGSLAAIGCVVSPISPNLGTVLTGGGMLGFFAGVLHSLK